jgi:hypothetical protein
LFSGWEEGADVLVRDCKEKKAVVLKRRKDEGGIWHYGVKKMCFSFMLMICFDFIHDKALHWRPTFTIYPRDYFIYICIRVVVS